MPPIWQKDEDKEVVYQPVQQHSPGMISFAYQPAASDEVQRALKDTETFKHAHSAALTAERS